MEETLTITLATDDDIARYRQSHELRSRAWRDQLVCDHVTALSRRITLAIVAGHDRTALDIATLLLYCEPLEQCAAESYEGALIHILHAYYCLRDVEAMQAAMSEALGRFAGDARLLRWKAMAATELGKEKRGKHRSH